jgi:predicted ATPase
MHYTKFIIRNFKGIKELELDLSRYPDCDIFTLVGVNESGKTTILEAIDFFQRDSLVANDRHKLIPKSQKTNFNDQITVESYISLDQQDEEEIKKYAEEKGYKLTEPVNEIKVLKKYTFEKSKYKSNGTTWIINLAATKLRGTKPVQINDKAETKEAWGHIAAEIRKNLFPQIIYYPNFLFDFPEKIYLESNSDFNAQGEEKQDFYRAVIKDVLISLDDDLEIEDLVSRAKSDKDEDKEALESSIESMSSKVSTTVLKAWELLFDAKNKDIVVSYGVETNVAGEQIVFLQMKLKEGINKYHISERSLGFRWFFSFLLLTEFRKLRRNESGKTLFLLDEPASNLHSTAQKRLLDTFEQIVDSTSPKNANCQLVYTTHSHHLINPKWLAGTFVVQNKAASIEDGKDFDASCTDIDAALYRNFAANHPDQKTYFQPILDAVEYQPSLIEQVPFINVLEGKNDYYTFKYFQEVIFKGKYDAINFYPGGGAASNSDIIALYMAWAREFRILLDGDKAGAKGKKQYLKDFGAILEDKIVPYYDINDDFKVSTEFLFSEADRLQVTQIYDTSATEYHKSQFNSAIQQIYIDGSKIKLDKETLANFKKIFGYLK